jgi:hypothetical protein
MDPPLEWDWHCIIHPEIRASKVSDPLATAEALGWLKRICAGREAVARKRHKEGYTARKIQRPIVGRVAKKLGRTQTHRLRAQTSKPLGGDT